MNARNTEKQIKGLEFLFIELPKFKPQNRAAQKLHELWLRFLTEINENTEEIPADLLKHEHIREAVGYMERAAYSKEQLLTYDKWKINMLTERGMIDDAREEGEIKGRIEGRIEGKAERDQLEAERDQIKSELQVAQERIAELERMMNKKKS